MGRVREIGAQFCAWEAIPAQASETVGSFARGDFVTLCCTSTLTARGSSPAADSQQPTAQQPDEMDQADLQQSQ